MKLRKFCAPFWHIDSLACTYFLIIWEIHWLMKFIGLMIFFFLFNLTNKWTRIFDLKSDSKLLQRFKGECRCRTRKTPVLGPEHKRTWFCIKYMHIKVMYESLNIICTRPHKLSSCLLLNLVPLLMSIT